MSSANNNTTKKEDNDFQIVREYLLKCPLLGPNNPAIRAALEGIDKEEKRQIRDAKLRSKFGGNDKVSTASKASSPGLTDVVVVEKASSDSFILEGNNSNDTDMEWQDVPQQKETTAIEDSFTMEQDDSVPQTLEDSFLGKALSKACIESIAQQSQRNKPVAVSTPLAAIAVALHVALRSDILGFACTGIPETKTKTIGFAPPIRELSKNEFLPKGWDNPQQATTTNDVAADPLRYRKSDTGAVVLTVEGHVVNDNGCATECRVTFAPTSSKDASAHACLKFPLSEHINLDSWNAATKAASNRANQKIAPSLHYKNLSGLLSKFCRTFDLGALHSDDSAMGGYDPMPGTVNHSYNTPSSSRSSSSSKMAFAPPTYARTMEPRPLGYTVPSTLDQAFPSVPASAAAARRRTDPRLMGYPHLPGGDFADDLLPSGLRDPRFGGPGIMGGGNLMGPNHPAFHGRVPGSLPPPSGPGSMQPRFDPIVPPCLNNNNNNEDPLRTDGGGGEPNPDHLPPPNSLGNNMFM